MALLYGAFQAIRQIIIFIILQSFLSNAASPCENVIVSDFFDALPFPKNTLFSSMVFRVIPEEVDYLLVQTYNKDLAKKVIKNTNYESIGTNLTSENIGDLILGLCSEGKQKGVLTILAWLTLNDTKAQMVYKYEKRIIEQVGSQTNIIPEVAQIKPKALFIQGTPELYSILLINTKIGSAKDSDLITINASLKFQYNLELNCIAFVISFDQTIGKLAQVKSKVIRNYENDYSNVACQITEKMDITKKATLGIIFFSGEGSAVFSSMQLIDIYPLPKCAQFIYRRLSQTSLKKIKLVMKLDEGYKEEITKHFYIKFRNSPENLGVGKAISDLSQPLINKIPLYAIEFPLSLNLYDSFLSQLSSQFELSFDSQITFRKLSLCNPLVIVEDAMAIEVQVDPKESKENAILVANITGINFMPNWTICRMRKEGTTKHSIAQAVEYYRSTLLKCTFMDIAYKNGDNFLLSLSNDEGITYSGEIAFIARGIQTEEDNNLRSLVKNSAIIKVLSINGEDVTGKINSTYTNGVVMERNKQGIILEVAFSEIINPYQRHSYSLSAIYGDGNKQQFYPEIGLSAFPYLDRLYYNISSLLTNYSFVYIKCESPSNIFFHLFSLSIKFIDAALVSGNMEVNAILANSTQNYTINGTAIYSGGQDQSFDINLMDCSFNISPYNDYSAMIYVAKPELIDKITATCVYRISNYSNIIIYGKQADCLYENNAGSGTTFICPFNETIINCNEISLDAITNNNSDGSKLIYKAKISRSFPVKILPKIEFLSIAEIIPNEYYHIIGKNFLSRTAIKIILQLLESQNIQNCSFSHTRVISDSIIIAKSFKCTPDNYTAINGKNIRIFANMTFDTGKSCKFVGQEIVDTKLHLIYNLLPQISAYAITYKFSSPIIQLSSLYITPSNSEIWCNYKRSDIDSFGITLQKGRVISETYAQCPSPLADESLSSYLLTSTKEYIGIRIATSKSKGFSNDLKIPIIYLNSIKIYSVNDNLGSVFVWPSISNFTAKLMLSYLNTNQLARTDLMGYSQTYNTIISCKNINLTLLSCDLLPILNLLNSTFAANSSLSFLRLTFTLFSSQALITLIPNQKNYPQEASFSIKVLRKINLIKSVPGYLMIMPITETAVLSFLASSLIPSFSTSFNSIISVEAFYYINTSSPRGNLSFDVPIVKIGYNAVSASLKSIVSQLSSIENTPANNLIPYINIKIKLIDDSSNANSLEISTTLSVDIIKRNTITNTVWWWQSYFSKTGASIASLINPAYLSPVSSAIFPEFNDSIKINSNALNQSYFTAIEKITQQSLEQIRIYPVYLLQNNYTTSINTKASLPAVLSTSIPNYIILSNFSSSLTMILVGTNLEVVYEKNMQPACIINIYSSQSSYPINTIISKAIAIINSSQIVCSFMLLQEVWPSQLFSTSGDITIWSEVLLVNNLIDKNSGSNALPIKLINFILNTNKMARQINITNYHFLSTKTTLSLPLLSSSLDLALKTTLFYCYYEKLGIYDGDINTFNNTLNCPLPEAIIEVNKSATFKLNVISSFGQSVGIFNITLYSSNILEKTNTEIIKEVQMQIMSLSYVEPKIGYYVLDYSPKEVIINNDISATSDQSQNNILNYGSFTLLIKLGTLINQNILSNTEKSTLYCSVYNSIQITAKRIGASNISCNIPRTELVGINSNRDSLYINIINENKEILSLPLWISILRCPEIVEVNPSQLIKIQESTSQFYLTGANLKLFYKVKFNKSLFNNTLNFFASLLFAPNVYYSSIKLIPLRIANNPDMLLLYGELPAKYYFNQFDSSITSIQTFITIERNNISKICTTIKKELSYVDSPIITTVTNEIAINENQDLSIYFTMENYNSKQLLDRTFCKIVDPLLKLETSVKIAQINATRYSCSYSNFVNAQIFYLPRVLSFQICFESNHFICVKKAITAQVIHNKSILSKLLLQNSLASNSTYFFSTIIAGSTSNSLLSIKPVQNATVVSYKDDQQLMIPLVTQDSNIWRPAIIKLPWSNSDNIIIDISTKKIFISQISPIQSNLISDASIIDPGNMQIMLKINISNLSDSYGSITSFCKLYLRHSVTIKWPNNTRSAIKEIPEKYLLLPNAQNSTLTLLIGNLLSSYFLSCNDCEKNSTIIKYEIFYSYDNSSANKSNIFSSEYIIPASISINSANVEISSISSFYYYININGKNIHLIDRIQVSNQTGVFQNDYKLIAPSFSKIGPLNSAEYPPSLLILKAYHILSDNIQTMYNFSGTPELDYNILSGTPLSWIYPMANSSFTHYITIYLEFNSLKWNKDSYNYYCSFSGDIATKNATPAKISSTVYRIRLNLIALLPQILSYPRYNQLRQVSMICHEASERIQTKDPILFTVYPPPTISEFSPALIIYQALFSSSSSCTVKYSAPIYDLSAGTNATIVTIKFNINNDVSVITIQLYNITGQLFSFDCNLLSNLHYSTKITDTIIYPDIYTYVNNRYVSTSYFSTIVAPNSSLLSIKYLFTPVEPKFIIYLSTCEWLDRAYYNSSSTTYDLLAYFKNTNSVVDEAHSAKQYQSDKKCQYIMNCQLICVFSQFSPKRFNLKEASNMNSFELVVDQQVLSMKINMSSLLLSNNRNEEVAAVNSAIINKNEIITKYLLIHEKLLIKVTGASAYYCSIILNKVTKIVIPILSGICNLEKYRSAIFSDYSDANTIILSLQLISISGDNVGSKDEFSISIFNVSLGNYVEEDNKIIIYNFKSPIYLRYIDSNWKIVISRNPSFFILPLNLPLSYISITENDIILEYNADIAYHLTEGNQILVQIGCSFNNYTIVPISSYFSLFSPVIPIISAISPNKLLFINNTESINIIITGSHFDQFYNTSLMIALFDKTSMQKTMISISSSSLNLILNNGTTIVITISPLDIIPGEYYLRISNDLMKSWSEISVASELKILWGQKAAESSETIIEQEAMQITQLNISKIINENAAISATRDIYRTPFSNSTSITMNPPIIYSTLSTVVTISAISPASLQAYPFYYNIKMNCYLILIDSAQYETFINVPTCSFKDPSLSSIILLLPSNMLSAGQYFFGIRLNYSSGLTTTYAKHSGAALTVVEPLQVARVFPEISLFSSIKGVTFYFIGAFYNKYGNIENKDLMWRKPSLMRCMAIFNNVTSKNISRFYGDFTLISSNAFSCNFSSSDIQIINTIQANIGSSDGLFKLALQSKDNSLAMDTEIYISYTGIANPSQDRFNSALSIIIKDSDLALDVNQSVVTFSSSNSGNLEVGINPTIANKLQSMTSALSCIFVLNDSRNSAEIITVTTTGKIGVSQTNTSKSVVLCPIPTSISSDYYPLSCLLQIKVSIIDSVITEASLSSSRIFKIQLQKVPEIMKISPSILYLRKIPSSENDWGNVKYANITISTSGSNDVKASISRIQILYVKYDILGASKVIICPYFMTMAHCLLDLTALSSISDLPLSVSYDNVSFSKSAILSIAYNLPYIQWNIVYPSIIISETPITLTLQPSSSLQGLNNFFSVSLVLSMYTSQFYQCNFIALSSIYCSGIIFPQSLIPYKLMLIFNNEIIQKINLNISVTPIMQPLIANITPKVLVKPLTGIPTIFVEVRTEQSSDLDQMKASGIICKFIYDTGVVNTISASSVITTGVYCPIIVNDITQGKIKQSFKVKLTINGYFDVPSAEVNATTVKLLSAIEFLSYCTPSVLYFYDFTNLTSFVISSVDNSLGALLGQSGKIQTFCIATSQTSSYVLPGKILSSTQAMCYAKQLKADSYNIQLAIGSSETSYVIISSNSPVLTVIQKPLFVSITPLLCNSGTIISINYKGTLSSSITYTIRFIISNIKNNYIYRSLGKVVSNANYLSGAVPPIDTSTIEALDSPIYLTISIEDSLGETHYISDKSILLRYLPPITVIKGYPNKVPNDLSTATSAIYSIELSQSSIKFLRKSGITSLTARFGSITPQTSCSLSLISSLVLCYIPNYSTPSTQSTYFVIGSSLEIYIGEIQYYLNPSITAISPNIILQNWANGIQITGNNFINSGSFVCVFIDNANGNKKQTLSQYISATSIICPIPGEISNKPMNYSNSLTVMFSANYGKNYASVASQSVVQLTILPLPKVNPNQKSWALLKESASLTVLITGSSFNSLNKNINPGMTGSNLYCVLNNDISSISLATIINNTCISCLIPSSLKANSSTKITVRMDGVTLQWNAMEIQYIMSPALLKVFPLIIPASGGIRMNISLGEPLTKGFISNSINDKIFLVFEGIESSPIEILTETSGSQINYFITAPTYSLNSGETSRKVKITLKTTTNSIAIASSFLIDYAYITVYNAISINKIYTTSIIGILSRTTIKILLNTPLIQSSLFRCKLIDTAQIKSDVISDAHEFSIIDNTVECIFSKQYINSGTYCVMVSYNGINYSTKDCTSLIVTIYHIPTVSYFLASSASSGSPSSLISN